MHDQERAIYEGMLLAAGIIIPPERNDVMFEAFRAYRELASVLNVPLPYGAEPAAIYLAAEAKS